MDRWGTSRRIESLDGEADHLEIYRLFAQQEFPWDVTRALETALYRTYAVPSIGGLLDRTGEFGRATQKRYDDTALLLEEVLVDGYDGPRGSAALARINGMHGRYPISNDDLLYVLMTFVVCPVRWVDRFGWRRTSATERQAVHAYYREVGTRMGITGIPSSYEACVRHMDDYERRWFAFTPANARVGVATRELFCAWFRPVPAALVRPLVHALLDEPVLDAFGMPHPHPLLRVMVESGLRARARVERLLPPRSRPARVLESWFIRSYPDGYRIGDLGSEPTQPELDEGLEPSPPAGRRTLLSVPRARRAAAGGARGAAGLVGAARDRVAHLV